MDETSTGLDTELRSLAESEAEDRRSAAGNRLEHVAHALEGAAASLEDEGEPGLGRMAEDLADRASRAGRYLREHDVRTIVDELESHARANPGRFFAGTALAGVLLGRFFRASDGEERTSDRDGEGELRGGGGTHEGGGETHG